MMIKKILEQLEPNSIKRIDDNHILDIYVGLNNINLPTILIRSTYSFDIPNSSKYIDIKKIEDKDRTKYYFILKDLEHFDMFIDIFNDIVEFTRNEKSEVNALKGFIKRYILWSNLFKKSKISMLTKNQIIGLYGELLYLNNYLIKQLGFKEAINAWFGPYKEKKDFEYNDFWKEVKMVKYGKDVVSINSVFQLDDINNGELVVFEYSETESNNLNLYSLVDHMLKNIISFNDVSNFTNRLNEAGYEHKVEYKRPNIETKYLRIIPITSNSNILRYDDLPKTVLDAVYKLKFKVLEGEIYNGPYKF